MTHQETRFTVQHVASGSAWNLEAPEATGEREWRLVRWEATPSNIGGVCLTLQWSRP